MVHHVVVRRAFPVTTALVVLLAMGAGTASALAPAKRSPKQTVKGNLTWTITRTLDDPGDPSMPNNRTENETILERGTLQIDVQRDRKFTRTYQFKRDKAPYTYAYESTREVKEWSFFEQSCLITSQGNSAGSGSTDASVSLIGKWNGNKDISRIDKRTKGISVYAQLPSSGAATRTYKGSGLSPCDDFTETDPLADAGSTVPNDSRTACIPQGMAKPNPSYQPLFGKWNNAKKRFDFRCTRTSNDGEYTQTISVTGSLKYKG